MAGPASHRTRRRRLLRQGAVGGCVLLAALGFITTWRRGSAADRWMTRMRTQGEKFTFVELGLVRPARPDPTFEALEVAAKRLKALEQAAVNAPYQELDGPSPDQRRVSWREPHLYSVMRRVLDWELAGALADQVEPDLAALHNALRDPARDPGWNYGELAVIPNYVNHREVAQSLHDLIMVELHGANLPAAHRDLLTLIRLCRRHAEGPSLVTQMILTALLGLASDAVWNALQAPGWTEDQLTAIQEELESVVIIPQLPRTFETERAARLADFDRYLREGPASRAWAWQYTSTPRPAAWLEQSSFFFWKMARSGKDRLQLVQFDQQVIDRHRRLAAGVAYRDLGPQPEPALSWWNRSSLAQTLFPLSAGPNFVRATSAVVRNDTERLLAIGALALERYQLRHGHYPAALSDLEPGLLTAVPKDALSGKALHYRLMPDGRPFLYSVGFNGRDDGGDVTPDPAATRDFYPPLGRDVAWRRPAAPSDGSGASASSGKEPPPDPVLPLIVLDDAPLQDAIEALAREAEINLVFDPAVSEALKHSVTVRLENVSARATLEAVLANYGLRMQEDPVTHITQITRR